MKVLAEEKVGGADMRLVQGDITLRDVDAIVNAANSHLKHGGGVAGAIVRRGGEIIQEESDLIGFTPVGTAVITTAGYLPASFVIHAVGPRMGEGDEDAKLRSAVESVLRLAVGNNIRTISMPAISSGIFGFPKDRCANILVTTSREFLRANEGALDLLEFCVFDEATAEHFIRELGKG
ncbi:macro domain-containing protein [Nitrospirota bacterium]